MGITLKGWQNRGALSAAKRSDNAGNRRWYKRGDDPNATSEFNEIYLRLFSNDPNSPYAETNAPCGDDPNKAYICFSYDVDGNLTEDVLYKYMYDAENRLTEQVPNKDPNELTDEDKKYVYTYDYLGRLVRTRVYAWDPNEAEWPSTPEEDRRYIYHGRLRLLELDDEKARVHKYIWGPGLGGGLGGPGSLLGIRDVETQTNYICFHDGGGSLCQLVDRSNGNVDAMYDYNGRTRAATDPCVDGPLMVDDCDLCGPCFFDWYVTWRTPYPICGCGTRYSNPGCGGTSGPCAASPLPLLTEGERPCSACLGITLQF